MYIWRNKRLQDSWRSTLYKITMGISPLFIILASIIWWFDGYFRQNISLSGSQLIALESTVAGIILFVWVFIFQRHKILKIQNIRALLGAIVFWWILGAWCFFHALQTTESLWFVYILIGMQPVFTILASALILHEHPKRSFYTFAATAIFASILLTLWETWWKLDVWSMKSYLYALGAAIFWWTSTTFNKIISEHNSHSYITSIRFLCTWFIAFIIIYLTWSETPFNSIIPTIKWDFYPILFIILFSNITAYQFYLAWIQKIPAIIATIFELSFPLTGFVIDFMIHDITPSSIKIVGAITILVSIIILPHCHFIEEKKKDDLRIQTA